MHEQATSGFDEGTPGPVGTSTAARRSAPSGMDLIGVLLDGVEDAATVSDPDGLVLYANPAAKTLFGIDVTRGAVSVVSLFDPASERADAASAAIEAGARASSPWKGRLSRIGSDGRPFVTQAQVRTIAVEGRSFRLWLERPSAGEPRDPATTEARLALSIAAGHMAVWDYDVASDRITGSPELHRLLGFPPGVEPTTSEIRARYYPGEQERLGREGRDALARGERFVESEFRYLWPDGSVHWVLLRAQALTDGSGRPTRALGIVMDITQRKRAEQALRSSEMRLKLAQDAAGIGVWDWDSRSQAVEWSPETYTVLGIEPDAGAVPHVGLWLRALHRDDRGKATETIRRAVLDAQPFSIDFRLQRRDGASPRWVRSRGAPVLGEDGKPTRYVGVNIDVTEEHRREERLLVLADGLRDAAAKAERERERIADLSNDLFAAVDETGGVLAINPAWPRLLGDEGRGFRGTRFLDLVHSDDRARAAASLSAVRGGMALDRFEARLTRSDGNDVWVAWTVATEGGTLYAVGRDVTLDRARDATLVQSQKMEALGQLTGGIAHDFNNLLQAVTGYVEMVRRHPDHPKLGHWIDNALLASDRGAKLTQQLLAFSRSQRIEIAAISIQAVLFDLGDLLRRTLGGAIRIVVDLPPVPLGVMADRTQLETALLNIAINARDAMPDGGSLTLTARALPPGTVWGLEAGDYVEIRMSDTGTGMPTDVASRAFDPFFTTKGVGKGTGLGLSQVHGMAQQAGGTARIESRPEVGTTVSLLLRRAAPPLNSHPAGSRASADPAFHATLLVVDDDPDVRSLLSDMLPSLGYAVDFASSGSEALASLDRRRPDLMMLDFAMPDMNGAEVAREALTRYPGLRIVFASGHADTKQIDAVVGSARRLRKPFRMGELADVLSEALSQA